MRVCNDCYLKCARTDGETNQVSTKCVAQKGSRIPAGIAELEEVVVNDEKVLGSEDGDKRQLETVVKVNTSNPLVFKM